MAVASHIKHTLVVTSYSAILQFCIPCVTDSHREQIAKKLNLQPQRRETLSVSTFGAGKPQNLETFVVEFSITTKEGMNIALHANVLSLITSPI